VAVAHHLTQQAHPELLLVEVLLAQLVKLVLRLPLIPAVVVVAYQPPLVLVVLVGRAAQAL
jgi:hypothetical protein